jgi:hypothetical protein
MSAAARAWTGNEATSVVIFVNRAVAAPMHSGDHRSRQRVLLHNHALPGIPKPRELAEHWVCHKGIISCATSFTSTAVSSCVTGAGYVMYARLRKVTLPVSKSLEPHHEAALGAPGTTLAAQVATKPMSATVRLCQSCRCNEHDVLPTRRLHRS